MFTRVLNAIDRTIAAISISVGWLSLIVLMGLRVYEVIGRQYTNVPSGMLRRYEALAFALLVVLALGYAYARNGHVRVDILRARLSPRAQAWIEIVGGLIVVLPLALTVIGLYTHFIHTEYLEGGRWWFGLIVPIGFGLLTLSGLTIIARNVLFLRGRAERPAPADPEGPADG